MMMVKIKSLTTLMRFLMKMVMQVTKKHVMHCCMRVTWCGYNQTPFWILSHKFSIHSPFTLLFQCDDGLAEILLGSRREEQAWVLLLLDSLLLLESSSVRGRRRRAASAGSFPPNHNSADKTWVYWNCAVLWQVFLCIIVLLRRRTFVKKFNHHSSPRPPTIKKCWEGINIK